MSELNPVEDSDQHNNQDQKDKNVNKKSVHRHSYSMCLMCSIGYHEDCVTTTVLAMTGKGDKWKYTNICECRDQH